MSPVRDFSQSVKETLFEYMKEIEEEDEKYWVFSGIFDWIADLGISGRVADYEGDIHAYHKSILDKKNTSIEQLEKIWQNVYSVDNQHASILCEKVYETEKHLQAFVKLADTLNPGAASANGAPALFGSRMGVTDCLDDSKRLEEAMDYAMQRELFKLMEDERFSEEVWRTADDEGRKQILQEFLAELQKVMGTHAVPVIDFYENGEPGARVAYADSSTREIHLNTAYINKYNRIEILRIVAHENRHVYQFEATSGWYYSENDEGELIKTEVNHIVTQRTRDAWVRGFNNQVDAREDREGYRTSPHEWDALGFPGFDQEGYSPDYPGSWSPEDT